MSTSSPLKNAAFAAAGAALLGGGMFLGFLSAMMRRKQTAGGDAPAPGSPAPDPVFVRRVDELAHAVADLQSRLDTAAQRQPEFVAERLEQMNLRVDQLERRVEQLVAESPAVPPIDQVLAAVEHMVAVKIAGLDERLSDQVHAIEMLRGASVQTDTLLQKLINAVETLADHTAERVDPEPPEPAPAPQRDYPIA